MDSAAFILVSFITLLKYARGQKSVTYPGLEKYESNATDVSQRNDRPLTFLQNRSAWIIYVVACGILAFLIVAGNLIVITVFSKSKKLRNPHSVYKISIAVSDLFFGVAILPLLIAGFTSRKTSAWIPLFFTFITTWISMLSLIFMGFNSMFAVSLPLKYKQYRKMIRKVNLISVILIWISPIPVLMLSALITPIGLFGGCLFLVWSNNIIIFIVVILKLRKMKARRSSGMSNSLGKEKTLAITLTIMSLAFTVTTLPYVIMFSLPLPFMMIDRTAMVFSLLFVAFTSGLWNCLIYNFRNKDFRDEGKKICKIGWSEQA